MTWWLLLLVVVAAALLAVREGFLATATIKNPNTWDAAELTRIKGLVSPPSTLTDAEIREVVGGFWSYSVPSRLPNEPATEKGWSVATNRIPTSDVTEYLDGIVRATPAYSSKRSAFSALITAYYITQGESTFSTASGYSAETSDSPPIPRPPSESEDTAAVTSIERPTSATQSLRQEIATTMGIPTTDTASIDAVVTKVQSFYDTVYVPNNKAAPTYTQMLGFADGIDTTTLPAAIQNNFKIRFVTILQTFFAPQSGTSVAPLSGGGLTAGAASASAAAGGSEEGAWAGTGKNVRGPASGGQGLNDNSTGGLGIPRNYPVLYGGEQSYSSAIPTSGSLGSDPTAKFLPFSRVPGDQDLYPDPYRLGKYFSTSSYSSKDAPEPAPFLADFSKFLT